MFVRTWNLLFKHFLPVKPQSLCIPFKFMCAFKIDKQDESHRFSTYLLLIQYHRLLSPDEPLPLGKDLKRKENLNLNFE